MGRKSKYTDEQIIRALKEVDAGSTAKDVCRKLGVTEQTFSLSTCEARGILMSRRRMVVFGLAVFVFGCVRSLDSRGLQNFPMDSRVDFDRKYERARDEGVLQRDARCQSQTFEAIEAASRDLSCQKNSDCRAMFRWIEEIECMVGRSDWVGSVEYYDITQRLGSACGWFSIVASRSPCSTRCVSGRCAVWPTQIFPPE